MLFLVMKTVVGQTTMDNATSMDPQLHTKVGVSRRGYKKHLLVGVVKFDYTHLAGVVKLGLA